MSCSTSKIAVFSLRLRNWPIMVWLSRWPSPAIGSSSSITTGCNAMAISSSSCFFSPCDRSATKADSRPCNWPSAMICAAASQILRRCATRSQMRKLPPARARNAMPTFCSTVISSSSEVIWNVRPRPSATRAGTEAWVTSCPASRITPSSGVSSPQSWLISVDLPAPFGPIRAWISFGRTSRVTPSVAVKPPKRLRRPSIARTAVICAPIFCRSAPSARPWCPEPAPAGSAPTPVANARSRTTACFPEPTARPPQRTAPTACRRRPE